MFYEGNWLAQLEYQERIAKIERQSVFEGVKIEGLSLEAPDVFARAWSGLRSIFVRYQARLKVPDGIGLIRRQTFEEE